MKTSLVIALVVLSDLCAHADASCVEPIFRLGPDYQYSWKKPRADLTWTADGFRLTADPGKAAKWWRDFANRHEHTFPYFVASEKAVVTFRYRSDVAASLLFYISKVFEGLAKWSGETYGPLSFDVPATALAKGRNEIVVRNPTPDPEAKFDGAGGANFRVKRDYNSSWFTVVSIAVEWQ